MTSSESALRVAVTNRLDNTVLGVVRVSGITAGFASDTFDRDLGLVLEERAAGLTDLQERTRAGVRNMLRNGVYKPTGRGKPASEYLLRAAQDPASFPRVNWPVDVCNYISLKFLLPISIWDPDAARTSEYVFRLGRAGEQYVFNSAGQTIALQDLTTGCAVRAPGSGDGAPIVNPVKDSMETKTGPETTKVVAAVYAPAGYEDLDLVGACREFAEWLERSADHPEAGFCAVEPGGSRLC